MDIGRRHYLPILISMAVPAAIALAFIAFFGRSVIFWDEWAMVPLYQKMDSGTLSLGDLFAQHNEHRLFFPKAGLLIIERLTHFNTVMEMYCSWGLICGILAVVTLLWFRQFGFSRESLFFFLPVPWLVFSLRQWENLLFGFQFGFFLCAFCVVFAFYLLQSSGHRIVRMIAPIIFAAIASFSNLMGFLVWPAGFLLIWWTSKDRKMLGIWAGSGIILILLQFTNWQGSTSSPSLLHLLQAPLPAAGYLFTLFGSPLGFGSWITDAVFFRVGIGISIVLCLCAIFSHLINYRRIAEFPFWIFLLVLALGVSLWQYVFLVLGDRLGFGSVISDLFLFPFGIGICFVLCAFAIFSFIVRHHQEPEHAIWLSLLVFSLGAALVLTIGRGGFGMAQALSSRYVTFLIPGIIACYSLAFSVCRKHSIGFPPGTLIFRIISILVLTGILIGFADGLIGGPRVAGEREEMSCILMHYSCQEDLELLKLFPSPNLVRTRTAFLENNALNIFYSPESAYYRSICESKNCTGAF